jgi:hypothetical protein
MSDDESDPKKGGLIEQTCIIVNKSTDPQTDKATGNPVAAMCVRKSSVRRVLQFTPFIGASSVLHRPASRVIHRLQLYCFFCLFSFKDCFEYWTRGLGLLPKNWSFALFALRKRMRQDDLFPRARSLLAVVRVETLANTPQLTLDSESKTILRLEERVLLLVQLLAGKKPTGNRRLERWNDRSFEHQEASL